MRHLGRTSGALRGVAKKKAQLEGLDAIGFILKTGIFETEEETVLCENSPSDPGRAT